MGISVANHCKMVFNYNNVHSAFRGLVPFPYKNRVT